MPLKYYLMLFYTLSLSAITNQLTVDFTKDDFTGVEKTQVIYIGYLVTGQIVIAHLDQSTAVIIHNDLTALNSFEQLPALPTYNILMQAYNLLNQPTSEQNES